MYFKAFPTIYYEFDIDGERVLRAVRDITFNARVRKEVLSNITLYDQYDIMEGETPEIISAKVYGTPLYHWVIMLVNERYHLEDFPVSTRDVYKYVEQAYDNINGIHHYVTEDGYVVPDDFPGAVPITNIEYEIAVNDMKRRIKLVSPQQISSIMSQLKGLL